MTAQMDEKTERVRVKFCFKIVKSASETYELLKTASDDKCVGRSNVFIWFNRLRDSCESVENDRRSGRPSTANFTCFFLSIIWVLYIPNIPIGGGIQSTRYTVEVSLSVCAKMYGRKGLHTGETRIRSYPPRQRTSSLSVLNQGIF